MNTNTINIVIQIIRGKLKEEVGFDENVEIVGDE